MGLSGVKSSAGLPASWACEESGVMVIVGM